MASLTASLRGVSPKQSMNVEMEGRQCGDGSDGLPGTDANNGLLACLLAPGTESSQPGAMRDKGEVSEFPNESESMEKSTC